jgi:non-specific serine/threonine protein kinase
VGTPDSSREHTERDDVLPEPDPPRRTVPGQPTIHVMRPPFSALLRQHRLAADLTQAGLAALAGLSARGVQNLERGIAQPRGGTASMLAAALALDGADRAAFLVAAQPHARWPRPADAPPERQEDSGRPPVPAALPVPLASFVGREHQLEQVSRLLSTNRLVTLTGTGGVGKTRLALEIARRALARAADGVQFVSLAALADPFLVESVVVHALGLRASPGQPYHQALALALRDRDLLLVLDNFEHLLVAARSVATWLQACPRLTVLVTSRTPLGLPGEQLYQVPPLRLPEAGAGTDTAEAVRLFVDRAHGVRADFRLTAQNAGAVAEICRRLDGLPLAIELAAVWARALSPQQLAARLDDRFRLLVRGSPTAPPRQRTLRGALDWSYALLSEGERTMLRRLSVFAGGWTLEAAEAVYASDDALEPLSGLVDKSLVIVDYQDGHARYRLLEVIRQYGAEHLAEAGEVDVVRRRHATWIVALAEQACVEMWGPEQATALRRLDAEHDNVRAALVWSEETGEVEVGLRLGWLLWRFWDQRGHYSEARDQLARLLAAGGVPSTARALALDAAGMLAFFQQDLSASRALLEEGLALGRALDHAPSTAMALTFLGALFMSQGELDQANAQFEACEPLRRAVTDEPTAFIVDSTWLLFAAIVARLQADERRAGDLLEAGLARCRARGDRSMGCYFLVTLASIALGQGDHDRATALLRENLILAHAVGNKMPIAMGIDELACVAAEEGHGQRAVRLFGAAETIWESLAATLLPWFRGDYERGLAAARLQLGEATFAAAWETGRAMPLSQAFEYALGAETSAAPTGAAATPTAAARLRRAAGWGADALTPREREVAALVAQGHANRQIAALLVMSKRTVEWHVGKLLARLELQSRAQLAVWAHEHGIVPTG